MTPEKAPSIFDVAIIGAGPVGLFGVFACGMLGLKTVVLDALPEIGGQCTALYPDKPIYDIPGFPSVLAGDLIAHLEAQAAPFHPTYRLGSSVTSITEESAPRSFTLTNAAGATVAARAILIACGAGAFGPNRPPLDRLADFEHQSVFYAVRDTARFDGKTVAIAGGGDSAVDWANILAPRTGKLYFIHRRSEFRAAPASVAALKEHIADGRVTPVIPYQLAALEGTNGQIETLIVKDLDGGTRRLTIDALLCFFGLSTNLGILGQLNLQVDDHRIVIDPTTGATSLPGLYAAGDGVTYPHKQKLILTGFAEIAQAAQAIDAFLNPGVARHHVHSTTKGVPGAA